jgi:hypothetical protein
VETATLTVALRSFSGNMRNICIFLKRKAIEEQSVQKARNWDASRKIFVKGSREENRGRRKTRFMWVRPHFHVGNATQFPVFFWPAWTGFEPKTRNSEMRRVGLAVSCHCGPKDAFARQQDTNTHDRQASMLSSKIHAMLVYNKGRQVAPFGTWIVCQLMTRGAVPVARSRWRTSQLERTKLLLPGTVITGIDRHPTEELREYIIEIGAELVVLQACLSNGVNAIKCQY